MSNDKLANTSAFGITLGGSSTRNDRFISWQSVVVSDGIQLWWKQVRLFYRQFKCGRYNDFISASVCR